MYFYILLVLTQPGCAETEIMAANKPVQDEEDEDE